MSTTTTDPRDVIAEIWNDATNAVCQAMQETDMCNCPDGQCLAATIELDGERRAALTASGLSIVPVASGQRATMERHPPEIEDLVLARDEWRGTALSSQEELVKAIARAEAAEAANAELRAALEKIAAHPIETPIAGRPSHGLTGYPSCQSIARAALTNTEDRT